jgi:hypothetical protein
MGDRLPQPSQPDRRGLTSPHPKMIFSPYKIGAHPTCAVGLPARRALRVDYSAPNRHVLGMAVTHGQLLDFDIPVDIRPLTDDGRAHGRRNQEQQRFAEHYVSSL